MARTDGEGLYEMSLAGPGPYLFLFEPHANRSNAPTAPLRFEIPGVPQTRLDLIVPAGAISGRVLDADGEGRLKAFRLSPNVWTPTCSSRSPVPPARLRRTGTASSCSPTWRRVAIWCAPVEARRMGSAPGPPSAECRSSRTRQLEMSICARFPARRVTGVVHGPNGPIEGAAVYLRDAEGRLLFSNGARTDAEGAFRVDAVPEGSVSVAACGEGFAALASGSKDVRQDQETSFALHLTRASLLTASAVDGRVCRRLLFDSGVRLARSGCDRRQTPRRFGRELQWGSLHDHQSGWGPCPRAGTRLSAGPPDGRRVTRQVEIDGSQPVDVELRF